MRLTASAWIWCVRLSVANGRGDPGQRKSSNSGGGSVTINFDFTELFDGFDDIEKTAGEVTRIAAQAAAEELYFEARLRCPESEDSHYFYGKNSKRDGVRYFFQPGNLRNAIYQVYSKDNSKENVRATYHIAWNHRKAPYGFMVEFGTSRAAANPFLRPAFDARYKEALEISRAVYVDAMRSRLRIVK